MVNREPALFILGMMNDFDVLARGLLPRVMVNASQSRTGFSISTASLDGEAVSPMNSHTTPSSARVYDGDVFSWVSDEPLDDMPVRAVFCR